MRHNLVVLVLELRHQSLQLLSLLVKPKTIHQNVILNVPFRIKTLLVSKLLSDKHFLLKAFSQSLPVLTSFEKVIHIVER